MTVRVSAPLRVKQSLSHPCTLQWSEASWSRKSRPARANEHATRASKKEQATAFCLRGIQRTGRNVLVPEPAGQYEP